MAFIALPLFIILIKKIAPNTMIKISKDIKAPCIVEAKILISSTRQKSRANSAVTSQEINITILDGHKKSPINTRIISIGRADKNACRKSGIY